MWEIVWFRANHEASPRLPVGQEVYIVELDLPSQLSRENPAWADLTESEQRRAQRCRSAQAQAQFVLCRSALRRWIGAYFGFQPTQVSLTANENGKPQLSPFAMSGNADKTLHLHFNVAHTEGKGLIAFANYPVGVDVERIRTVRHMEGLIQRYLSPFEYAQWQSGNAPDRPNIFFRLWTGKEAVIKTVGRSLASLECFDLLLHGDGSATIATAHAPEFQGPWYIQSWKRDEKYWITLAVKYECGQT
jgi:4'-phosphopantetheinyl transferase